MLLDCQATTGADLGEGGGVGGGGGGRLSVSRIRPPADPKGPLCTVLKYPFLVTDPENFLRAPLAPFYTNFEEEVRT